MLGRAFGRDVGQVERVLAGNRNRLGAFSNVGIGRRDNFLFADCDIGRVGNAADFEQVGVLNLLGRERVRLAVVCFRPEGVGRGRIDVGRLVVGNVAELVGVLGCAFGRDIGQVERVIVGNRNSLGVFRNVGLSRRDNFLVADCDIGSVGNAAEREESFLGVVRLGERVLVRVGLVLLPVVAGLGRCNVVDSVSRLVHSAEVVGGFEGGFSLHAFARERERVGVGDTFALRQGEFGRAVRNVRLGNADRVRAVRAGDDALFDSGVDAVEREQSQLINLRREVNLLGVFRVDFVAAGVVGVVVGGSGRAAFHSVEVFLGLLRLEVSRVRENQFVVARDCDVFAVDSVGCVFECVVAEREGCSPERDVGG